MFKQATVLGAFALSITFAAQAFAADPTADTVVATVNGHEITLGHMISTRESLPAQYQELDDAVLFDGILEQLIQQTALAEVEEAALTRRDLLALDNQRRTYLAGVVLDTTANAAVTEDALNAAYDEKYSSAAPGKEFHAAHILVETEEEAKAYTPVSNNILDKLSRRNLTAVPISPLWPRKNPRGHLAQMAAI